MKNITKEFRGAMREAFLERAAAMSACSLSLAGAAQQNFWMAVIGIMTYAAIEKYLAADPQKPRDIRFHVPTQGLLVNQSIQTARQNGAYIGMLAPATAVLARVSPEHAKVSGVLTVIGCGYSYLKGRQAANAFSSGLSSDPT